MKKFLILSLFSVLFSMTAEAQYVEGNQMPETPKTAAPASQVNDKLDKKNQKSLNDAVFGAYLNEVQKEIKSNWNPPICRDSRRIIVLFVLDKEGNVLSKKILQSSNNDTADNAALNAVDKTAPFKPFPVGAKEDTIKVHFTFDYNERMKK